MKLKDLLNGRKKLKEYDELKEAKDFFGYINPDNPINFNIDGEHKTSFSPRIIGIIISALEAEIAKLEEE